MLLSAKTSIKTASLDPPNEDFFGNQFCRALSVNSQVKNTTDPRTRTRSDPNQPISEKNTSLLFYEANIFNLRKYNCQDFGHVVKCSLDQTNLPECTFIFTPPPLPPICPLFFFLIFYSLSPSRPPILSLEFYPSLPLSYSI